MDAYRTVPAPSFSRAELHRWLLLVIAIAYWANAASAPELAQAGGLALVLDSVLARGAFCLAAWLMIGRAMTRTGTDPRPAAAWQIAAAVALCLLVAIPARQTAVIALLIAGLMLFRAGKDSATRGVAILLLWLAAEMAWTSSYALPLHVAVAGLDARIVGAILRGLGIAAAAHDNIVDNLGGGFGLEILAPCASSFPLVGVGLAFTVTALFQGEMLSRRHLPWLGAAMLASIALTECRLTWMATDEATYHWLHDGSGGTLYTLAAVLLAGLFPLLATRPLAREAVAS